MKQVLPYLILILTLTGISCSSDSVVDMNNDFPGLTTIRHTYGELPEQYGELRMPDKEGKVPVVMLIHGGCWVSFYDLSLMDKMAEELTRGIASQYPERYRDGSPINQLPLNVPQILVQGEADFIVPMTHVRPYYDSAVAKQENIELISLPRTGHFEVTNPESAVWDTIFNAFEKLLD